MPRYDDVELPLRALDVWCATVPTDRPESDGTLTWDSTTVVVVEVEAGGERGTGYTYTHRSAGAVARDVLWPAIEGLDARATPAAWTAMRRAVRNIGSAGVAATAISAVDTALWDLRGRLLGVPAVALPGRARAGVPAYGSGGFTSYDDAELAGQLGGWAERGLARVKMKVGREPGRDPHRVDVARAAIGPGVDLFVDANGAYRRKQALALAGAFADRGVSWYEEPVSSDDLEGLRLLRDRAPAGLDIAAGEYAYDLPYVRRMLGAGAVDVLQLDATRCGGWTGFLAGAAVAEAAGLEVSAHCAPALHAPLAASVRNLRHVEWFHDHVRVEALLFDGVAPLRGGLLWPGTDPGTGLTFKRADAEPYAD